MQEANLFFKTNPLVSSLSLYDTRGAPGVAGDEGMYYHIA